MDTARDINRPWGLLAELTYACPLHCPYCSNPLNMEANRDEMDTQQWSRILREARDLGVLQLHLSGGEPLQRHDIVDITRNATELGMYTNLVTSALGFSKRRAEQLRDAGLGHVQISFQAHEAGESDRIAGTQSFDRKIAVSRMVKQMGWPLTINVVLHRQNIDALDKIVRLAEDLDADRVELANTQYYGWAAHNRAALLPDRQQLARAARTIEEARDRLAGTMELIYVLPDFYGTYPKPCMGGWGSRQLTVTPNGDALPCPGAHELPLPEANVRDNSLAWIWEESPVFQRFRGTDWMPEPCLSCARRDIDFGGCRCQAFQLTGDAARTDPVCVLSPDHHIVTEIVETANEPGHDGELVHRTNPRRRRPVSPTQGI